ncbi:hypothetical protein ENH_00001880 [Eimeria necatrix]|uniref:Uncharacterized protein n=1 Tax=Eimeria necatrix TaxID=51315 RepID=U6MRW4_9EIME|nr:hypothetical protein ENH_00001880 [Eimeria necatrix]CDJ65199.1 hypothetical protein ENH_00001880 [Eimeria necatrix]
MYSRRASAAAVYVQQKGLYCCGVCTAGGAHQVALGEHLAQQKGQSVQQAGSKLGVVGALKVDVNFFPRVWQQPELLLHVVKCMHGFKEALGAQERKEQAASSQQVQPAGHSCAASLHSHSSSSSSSRSSSSSSKACDPTPSPS